MVKSNRKNVFFYLLAVFVFSVICLILFPLTAKAFDSSTLYENKPVQSGDPLYFADSKNDNYWVVSQEKWHKCIYDNSDYDKLTDMVRQAMYNREDSCSAYFLVDKKADADDIYHVFSAVENQVYDDYATPYGGDYLKYMSKIELNENSGVLTASSNAPDYDFYRITFNIGSHTTKAEEDMIAEYLERFNEVYIKNNETIKNASAGDKEYYIVKTIYNFLAKNTVYDMDVYQGKFDADTERYRYSHTAYGALFGNVEGAYNPESFDITSKMNLDYQSDSQGLYRIHTRNQGRSVCDGYSLVFYYLCKLNGIDCRIVKGDYTGNVASDPHAWNMVYLKDYNDADYTWYALDATFGCQKSKKISDLFSIIDYTYFLRGSENESFSPENHQQLYNEYKSLIHSKTDYEFEISSINEDKLYTVITRRRDADADKEFIDTGEYNLENYLIIAPDGKFYKADADDAYSFIASDGFEFYSSGYYYSCECLDLAKGIEYSCEDKFIRDAGEYVFDVVTVKDNVIYKKNLTVNALDMSDWSNYDRDLTKYSNNTNFIGEDIPIQIDVFDNSKYRLTKDKDYTVICYKKGDNAKTDITPNLPGEYIVEVIYKGNYSGTLTIPFTVHKADMSELEKPSIVNSTYSFDIAKGCETLSIGNVKIYSGTDYKIEVIGGLNYGDKGKIVFTGLRGSKYVQEGTVSQWDYIISSRYDISSLFNNKYISNAKYKYTGKAITPTDFKLSIKSSDGKVTTLVRGKDYKIVSYSNNIYAGTGRVQIEFIGNYTGTATMMFYIVNGSLSISCSDLTYNGKTQSPSPVVKVGDAVLKKGTDYTVSGNAANPGIYQGTIKGKGKFSNLSGKFIYYIKPNALSGVKTSTTQNSINVSWNKQGNSCIYEIWVYDTGVKGYKKLAQTSGASYKITSVLVKGKKTAVKPNTEYKIRVRAVISGKVNGKSVTKNGAIKELKVRTNPKKLSCKVAKQGKNALRVTWNKDTTVTGYQVYLSTSKNFKSGVKGVTISKNSNYAYTFKNLKKGKTYYVRMRSYKKVGKVTYYSAYSSIVKIKL